MMSNEGGLKYDAEKAPMELLDNYPLTQIANVFGFGANKYGRFNYKKGIAWNRLISAAYRHLGAFNAGEDLDPESKLHHLAHLGCCIFMLLEYTKTHPELDNRYETIKNGNKDK